MTSRQDTFKTDKVIICKLIRNNYSRMTDGLSDDQIMNDIVTMLLARLIKPKAHNKLYKILDNI